MYFVLLEGTMSHSLLDHLESSVDSDPTVLIAQTDQSIHVLCFARRNYEPLATRSLGEQCRL